MVPEFSQQRWRERFREKVRGKRLRLDQLRLRELHDRASELGMLQDPAYQSWDAIFVGCTTARFNLTLPLWMYIALTAFELKKRDPNFGKLAESQSPELNALANSLMASGGKRTAVFAMHETGTGILFRDL